MLKYLFLALILTMPVQTRAAGYCDPAQNISVDDCEDNDTFVNAGEACLTKLEKEVQDASKAMRSKFDANTSQEQAKKYGSSLKDYNLSTATLAKLLSSAEAAILDINAYIKALAPPEDSDEPDVNGGNEENYKNSVACYGESKRSLQGEIEDVLHVIDDLEKAKAASAVNAGTSGARNQNIQSGDQKPKLRTQPAKSYPSPKAGKAPGTIDSDVTGVEKDKAGQKSLK
jgi:hypothetical protein